MLRRILAVTLILSTIAIFAAARCHSSKKSASLPDFRIGNLQVTMSPSAAGYTNWSMTFVVENLGGTSGLVDDQGNPVSQHIPILFTAIFPETRPEICLMGQSGTLEEERLVPVSPGGNHYGFSNVFTVGMPPDPNEVCVPKEILVEYDQGLARTSVGTVVEVNERNNMLNVQIVDFPHTNTWTSQIN